MKKLLGILMAVMLGLTGCGGGAVDGSDMERSEYDINMEKAEDSIIENDLNVALAYLQLALKEEPKDKEAKKLIDKLEILKDISDEPEDVEEIVSYIKLAQKAIKLNTAITAADSKIDDRVEELKNMISDKISAIEETLAEGDYKAGKEELENILNILSKQKDVLGVEIAECEAAIIKADEVAEQKAKEEAEKKKAEEEALAKKKAEEAAKKKAEAAAKKKAEEEAKKKAEEEAKKKDNEKVYCETGYHYVKRMHLYNDTECCGCVLRMDLYKPALTFVYCPNCCTNHAVSQLSGYCMYCDAKILREIVTINNNGSVVYDDGLAATANDIYKMASYEY